MRYTRQELKQDKLKQTAAGAMDWSAAHQRPVTLTIIAVVVAVAVIGGGWFFVDHRSDQAAAALGAAMQVNNAPILPKGTASAQVTAFETSQLRAEAAKKAFYDVSSNYGSTRSGKIAKYMAGLAEVELGNYKVAEDDFKEVASSGDSSVSSLARFALASVYRATNRDADAISIYKELIDHPTESVPKVSAQLELADLYSAKQPDEAKKLYAQIQKDNEKAFAGQLAAQRLSSMK